MNAGLNQDSGLDAMKKGGHARQSHATKIILDTEMFLELSSALSLHSTEEQALLDLPANTLALLRAAPSKAFQLGGPKLERRLDYAVPILKRMIASIAC